jgi:hypothetical protein
MAHIDSFLEKFKRLLESGTNLKKEAVEVIKGVIGKEIDSEKVTIKDGIVQLKINPLFKSEIFLKKEKILKSLQDKGFKIFDIK